MADDIARITMALARAEDRLQQFAQIRCEAQDYRAVIQIIGAFGARRQELLAEIGSPSTPTQEPPHGS